MDISAPESGWVNTVVRPFNEDIWITMVGADSIAVENTTGSRLTALVEGVVTPCVGAPCCHRRLQQTLAKWPVLLQLRHIARYAGQFWRPPWWCPAAHSGHMLGGLCEVPREVSERLGRVSFAKEVLVISTGCWFAAFWAWHFKIAASSVSSRSFSKSSLASPSKGTSTFWSWINFWAHSSVQKLQVLANSLKLTKKSSKDWPGSWRRWRKWRLLMDSFICPSTYWLIAAMICVASWRWAAVSQKFSTTVTVSREKHRVSAWTCVTGSCFASPERLVYASHWALHALKSQPRSTWRSIFGRSPGLNR